MKNKFEAVQNEDGTWAVKTQIRKGGHWYTAADTFCIPNGLDGQAMAETIANALNGKGKTYNQGIRDGKAQLARMF